MGMISGGQFACTPAGLRRLIALWKQWVVGGQGQRELQAGRASSAVRQHGAMWRTAHVCILGTIGTRASRAPCSGQSGAAAWSGTLVADRLSACMRARACARSPPARHVAGVLPRDVVAQELQEAWEQRGGRAPMHLNGLARLRRSGLQDRDLVRDARQPGAVEAHGGEQRQGSGAVGELADEAAVVCKVELAQIVRQPVQGTVGWG